MGNKLNSRITMNNIKDMNGESSFAVVWQWDINISCFLE